MRVDEHRNPRLLLVEDNPADVRLAQEAVKQAALPVELVVVEDGEQALEFLNARGAFAGVDPPDLVLLDLNLPGIDGREVLEIVKSDDSLRHLPVVVMTTSESEEDVRVCYGLHANGYVPKPIGLDAVCDALRAIHDFWFSTARLPGRLAPTRR